MSNLKASVTLAAATDRGIFVDASGAVVTTTGSLPFGVTAESGSAGDRVDVFLPGGAKIECLAHVDITAGSPVKISGSAGGVGPQAVAPGGVSDTWILGTAVDAATAGNPCYISFCPFFVADNA